MSGVLYVVEICTSVHYLAKSCTTSLVVELDVDI